MAHVDMQMSRDRLKTTYGRVLLVEAGISIPMPLPSSAAYRA